MRTHLFSSVGTLKIGMDILSQENVKLDQLLGMAGSSKQKALGKRSWRQR